MNAERQLRDDRETIVVVVVSLVTAMAFFATDPLYRDATQAHPSAWLLVLVPALNTTFLAGFSSLAFGLLPLPFLPGHRIISWSKTVWVIISSLGLIGYIAVLLSPGTGSHRELRHFGIVPMAATFVLFALVPLGFMAYHYLRPAPEGDFGPDRELIRQ